MKKISDLQRCLSEQNKEIDDFKHVIKIQENQILNYNNVVKNLEKEKILKKHFYVKFASIIYLIFYSNHVYT